MVMIRSPRHAGMRAKCGQGLLEYAVLLMLVALVVMAVFLIIGPLVEDFYGSVLAGL